MTNVAEDTLADASAVLTTAHTSTTAASANHTADITLEDPGQRQGGTVPCCS